MQAIFSAKLRVESKKWEINEITNKKFINTVIEVLRDAGLSKHAHAVKWLSQNPDEGEGKNDFPCLVDMMICNKALESDIVGIYEKTLKLHSA